MAGKLQDEIRQNKPFTTVETEALLALHLTSDRLASEATRLLKPWDLSPTQYNVLRILRGAEPDGLPCRGIGDRMIQHDPDITRLMDRLEKRGLVGRERDSKDRRVVITRITQGGLELLDQLDGPVEEFNVRRLDHVGPEKLRTLIELLELVRKTGE
jgi:MarR family transcriptional regulator, organic hydroperoxide resistance regulator